MKRSDVDDIVTEINMFIKTDCYQFLDIESIKEFNDHSRFLGEILNKHLNFSDQSKIYTLMTSLKDTFDEDALAMYTVDPAANSLEEVKQFYPGYKAVVFYRIAHILFEHNKKELARGVSEYAHSITGIDIHPGATIGKHFAIDHGTGVVIGETAEIGDNVTIYQGVTLGAIHLENRDQVGQKRHPTIKDNVVIYANATILGGDTVIGEGATIGANTYITKSVGAGETVKR